MLTEAAIESDPLSLDQTAFAGSTFMSEESELIALANDVFKTPGEAREWLLRPHPLLDGYAPLDVAKSATGLQRVVEILLAIKYGSLA